MKKVWIGVGVAILVIVLAGIIAKKNVPVYSTPIDFLTIGLVIMLPMAVLLVYFFRLFAKDFNIKKIDKAALAIFLLFEASFLVAFCFGGVRAIRATADIVSGPKEKVVTMAAITEEDYRGHKGAKRTICYMTGITDENERTVFKVKVPAEKLEDVKAVRKKGIEEYGYYDAQYRVCYFEHIDMLYELQLIEKK